MGVELAREDLLSAAEKVADYTGLFVSKVERHPGHSHKSSELAEILRQPTIPWESSLLAKTDFQPPEKVAECPGLFASNLTPTGSNVFS